MRQRRQIFIGIAKKCSIAPFTLLLIGGAAAVIGDVNASASLCRGSVTLTGSAGTIDPGCSTSSLCPNSYACRWIIQSSDATKVVKLNFTWFTTECSWDFLTVSNVWPNGSTTPIAQLCGNRTNLVPYDLIVSSSPTLQLDFATDLDVQSVGFTANYAIVGRCDSSCSGRGACVNGQCACVPTATGVLCENDYSGFAPLTARSEHAAIYDDTSDSMLITGGQTLSGNLHWDTIQFNFGSNTWAMLPSPSSPSDRRSHNLVRLRGSTYMYGGITSGGATADLWRYSPATNIWSQVLPSTSVVPESAYWPIVVAAEQENVILVIGGWMPYFGSLMASRNVYSYSPVQNAWTQRNQSSAYDMSLAATLRSPAVYRPSSGFVHIFGVNSVQSYHVATDTWFYDSYNTAQSSMNMRVYGTANLINDSYAALFGGQASPFQTTGDAPLCYRDDIVLFDLDCWTVDNVTSLPGKARRSHTSIQRGNNLIVMGGSNGKDLQDVLNLPLVLPTKDSTARAACRAATWCQRSRACWDCVAIPGCGWCNNQCTYGCTNLSCASVGATRIYTNQSVSGTLNANAAADYQIFINLPDDDLTFSIASNTETSFTLSLLNLPGGQVQTRLPFTLYAADSRRFGGLYQLKLTNEGQQAQQYIFRISSSPANRITLPGDDSSSPTNVNSYLVLICATLSLMGSFVFTYRRVQRARRAQRDRQEQLRGGAAVAAAGGGDRGRSTVGFPPIFTVRREDLVYTVPEGVEVPPIQPPTGEILKTAVLADEDDVVPREEQPQFEVTVAKEDDDEEPLAGRIPLNYQVCRAKEWTDFVPISAERVSADTEDGTSNGPVLVDLSYLVLMPGAAYIVNDQLPPMMLGTMRVEIEDGNSPEFQKFEEECKRHNQELEERRQRLGPMEGAVPLFGGSTDGPREAPSSPLETASPRQETSVGTSGASPLLRSPSSSSRRSRSPSPLLGRVTSPFAAQVPSQSWRRASSTSQAPLAEGRNDEVAPSNSPTRSPSQQFSSAMTRARISITRGWGLPSRMALFGSASAAPQDEIHILNAIRDAAELPTAPPYPGTLEIHRERLRDRENEHDRAAPTNWRT